MSKKLEQIFTDYSSNSNNSSNSSNSKSKNKLKDKREKVNHLPRYLLILILLFLLGFSNYDSVKNWFQILNNIIGLKINSNTNTSNLELLSSEFSKIFMSFSGQISYSNFVLIFLIYILL
jgi:hypothetical protein